VHFYSCLGDDSVSEKLQYGLSGFPLRINNKIVENRSTPSTVVLSDPTWCDYAGERTFINTLGSALDFSADMLDEDFFNSDICLWGGTALVPPLHDGLASLCAKVHQKGGFNIVGTVYDFRNQSADPSGPWPLGTHENPAYPWIDILITDWEEALRLSQKEDAVSAARFFLDSGCGACIITRGKEDVYVETRSERFVDIPGQKYPVSRWVNEDLHSHPDLKGDTTGCGDNFMGGVLVSVARQISEFDKEKIDLRDAVMEGICTGGFSLYQVGGVFRENTAGEKEAGINRIKKHYREQIL
jgi:sugar/nucleoside kinase (ribokinase family)